MSSERVNILTIRTPEGCSFSLLLAGPIVRFFAFMIDLLCVLGLSILIQKLVNYLAIIDDDMAWAIYFLAYFVIWLGYGIILESLMQGRTFGKKVFHLRVVDEHGLRLTFGQIVIRNLLRFVDMLPAFYLVGGLACLVSRRCQRLGDFAANTVVVRIPKVSQPDVTSVLGDKFNSFRNHPHLEAKLRQEVSPQQARIALQAIIRREDLDPVDRMELFANIAQQFKSIIEFPPGELDGVSDEQYVRNILDSLYRPQRDVLSWKQ